MSVHLEMRSRREGREAITLEQRKAAGEAPIQAETQKRRDETTVVLFTGTAGTGGDASPGQREGVAGGAESDQPQLGGRAPAFLLALQTAVWDEVLVWPRFNVPE